MSRITLSLVLGVTIFLASCSGTTAPAATVDTYASEALPAGYDGALPVRNQLALGILELNQTASPITAEQAQLLIPLWQALRSTQESGGQATAEVNALLAQIESTLTPQQLSSIADKQLTFTDMQTWAAANGIQLGTNGGVPGQGMGLSPEAKATKQAAEGMTSTSASGSKMSSALTDAVIAALEASLP